MVPLSSLGAGTRRGTTDIRVFDFAQYAIKAGPGRQQGVTAGLGCGPAGISDVYSIIADSQGEKVKAGVGWIMVLC